MSNMSEAISLTIQNEGGYCDISADRGGPTNMGITQADLPNVDIKNLTQEQAVSFYAQNYWKTWMGDIESQKVCNKVFDMAVLLSVDTAVRLLQRALKFPFVQQDGNFGPHTLAATNETGDNLLSAYKSVLVAHFRWVVQQDPTQQEFLNGWVARINS